MMSFLSLPGVDDGPGISSDIGIWGIWGLDLSVLSFSESIVASSPPSFSSSNINDNRSSLGLFLRDWAMSLGLRPNSAAMSGSAVISVVGLLL